uniref:Uncharacterized protein n=1 Tax=Rhizophora mucronata TaxID=61149 RepID=A0A2P2QQN8_RHIMU
MDILEQCVIVSQSRIIKITIDNSASIIIVVH